MSIVSTSSSKGGPKVSFVNRVLVDKCSPLMPSYQQCLRDTFKAKVENHDFQNQIDPVDFVRQSCIVKSVIGALQIHSLTGVIMANKLYFKGFWKDKFNPEVTEEREFYPLNGDKISVPFMTSSETYLYGSFDEFKVLEIPYRSGLGDESEFCMQLILPHEKDGLQNLLEKFNADSYSLNGKFDGLRMTRVHPFWIPKFKFTYILDNIRFSFMDERPIWS